MRPPLGLLKLRSRAAFRRGATDSCRVGRAERDPPGPARVVVGLACARPTLPTLALLNSAHLSEQVAAFLSRSSSFLTTRRTSPTVPVSTRAFGLSRATTDPNGLNRHPTSPATSVAKSTLSG